jgi:prolyl-tRNA editing enzyme YbaK/EbsC (Cys-tRNA(Pro) deacylase)
VSKAVDRFERAARERGLSLEVLRFPQGTKTAQDAARAVGCEVGQIVKSLVFMAGTEPILALTSGANRADVGKLSRLVGGVPVRRADADEARGATGFTIGGTPPFGFTGQVRVFMDSDLFRYDEVWAAAGTPDAVFRTTPDELRSAAGADVGDFKEEV